MKIIRKKKFTRLIGYTAMHQICETVVMNTYTQKACMLIRIQFAVYYISSV
jgi:hypothetical protein